MATNKRKRRGRKPAEGVIHTELESCLKATEHGKTCIPYRVELCGQTRFIWSTSATAAVRLAAYSLGAVALPVSPQEIVDCLIKPTTQGINNES